MNRPGPTVDAAAPWSGQEGWHVARWGVLGWVETALKSVGITVGVIAAATGGAFAVPATGRIAYWAVVAVAVGYLVAVFDRWADKEIVAMGFLVAMLVGHWTMVYAMGRPDGAVGAVRLFATMMLTGDVVKIVYFATSGARVRGLPPMVPIVMTSILVAVYALVIAIA
jgi:hypothetical protein